MTVVTPLGDGVECLKMTLTDGQDEIRVHFHTPCQWYGCDGGHVMPCWLEGLLIKNAARGVLYEEGDVVGNCA